MASFFLFCRVVQRNLEIIKHADVALYNAKNAGRNRVVGFDPDMCDRSSLIKMKIAGRERDR